VRLVPLLLDLERRPGPLRPQVLAALAAHGRPLRWAITGVAPATASPSASADIGPQRLQVEAVVLA
jgi:hypothetical protein